MRNSGFGKNSKSVINLIVDSNTGSHCQLDRFFFKTVVRCTGNTFIGYSSYSSVKVDFFRIYQRHVHFNGDSQIVQVLPCRTEVRIEQSGFYAKKIVQLTLYRHPCGNRHFISTVICRKCCTHLNFHRPAMLFHCFGLRHIDIRLFFRSDR